MTEQTRLGCLKAALELRTTGSTTEELLALAERFYRFVLDEGGKAQEIGRASCRERV